jgi:hypothetical protein
MEHVIAETLSGEVRGIVNNGISVFASRDSKVGPRL